MTTSRRSARVAPRGSQATLSFGGRSKVTKPSVSAQAPKKNVAAAKESLEPSPSVSDVELPPTTADKAITEQAKEEVQKVVRTREEELAMKINDAQLKRYWKEREAERKALRVHQEGLDLNEKILRHFDLSSQYGPCIGTARMKRWNRANKLNLHPPIEVLAVLLKEEAKGSAKSERAYIDELLSSRFVTE